MIEQLQHIAPSPGRWLVRRIIKGSQQLAEREVVLDIHQVPGHMREEGNRMADEAAKRAGKVSDI